MERIIETSTTPEIERIVVQERAPIPSKDALIEEWFDNHPEDLKKTVRELEQITLPFGVTAGKSSWSRMKAKRTK